MFDGPGLHRIALNKIVGLFARQALFDESEEDGLGVPHAEGQTQILLHVLGIDDESVHQLCKRDEHVIQQRAGIRENDALNGAMADVAFMPECDIFQSGNRVPAENARKAREAFAGDGIAFVWHRARTLLAPGEELLGFEHFGALEVTEFGGPALNAGSDEGQSADKLSMNIALYDLCRDGSWTQTEFLAYVSLDLWG